MKLFLTGLFLCLFFTSSIAQNLESIAKEKTWLKLGFYQQKNQNFESSIVSPDFFLSGDGKQSPYHELQATIAAFKTPFIADKSDEHAICRFPARYIWLQSQGLIDSLEDPFSLCHKYNQWLKPETLTSVSLIFVTGYLENPASSFGHVLLKLNNKAYDNVDLLNQAINYGAIVPDGENGLLYTLFGLFGGYEAAFTAKNVYEETLIYRDKELRDLWEYPLNLTQQQISLLTAHVWELLGQKFQYYFVDENCSFQMGELLKLVLHDDIISNHGVWNIPASLFHDLKENKVIDEAILIPSLENTVVQSYKNLNTKESIVFKSIIKNENYNNYSALNTDHRINVSDALIQYYQYKAFQDFENKDIHIEEKNKWLLNRIKEPAKPIKPFETKLFPPTDGQKPSLFQLSNRNTLDSGSDYLISLAVTHHDRLSLQKGAIKDTTFSAFNAQLKTSKESINLEAFTFLELTKYVTDQSDFLGDEKLSWKIKASYERQSKNKNRNFLLTGGLGKSHYFNSILAYGFIVGTLEVESASIINAHSEAVFGGFYDWNKKLTSHIEVKHSEKQQTHYEIFNRWLFEDKSELRIGMSGKKGEVRESNLSYLYYW